MKIPKKQKGFTLVELIIYLAIVSIILVTISYLIIDIFSSQTRTYSKEEVNQNLRFIVNYLVKDIKAAEGIGNLTADILLLNMPGDDVTYSLNSGSKTITRQLGTNPTTELNSDQVEVLGSFSNLSYQGRNKNVGVNLIISYKNPGNLPDYGASSTAAFAVELRGKR